MEREVAKPKCAHPVLTFGSGGYYVFCHGCGGQWTATGDAEGFATNDHAIRNRAKCCSGVSGERR